MASSPLGYFITYRTYGTWLHGDEKGSVDRSHNGYGASLLPPDEDRRARSERRMLDDAVTLNALRRGIVDETIRQVCEHRGWTLHELNVRTTHVHIVITANFDPDRIMNSLKSWATRRMVERGAIEPRRKVWTRHGSTRYLWTPKSFQAARQYVVDEQGEDLRMIYE